MKHIFRHQFFQGDVQKKTKMAPIIEQNHEETIKSMKNAGPKDRPGLSFSQKSYLNLKSKSGMSAATVPQAGAAPAKKDNARREHIGNKRIRSKVNKS